MPKPETKFWHELKRITPQIKWTRLENSSVFGCPDLLGYNTSGHFFTVELKITSNNKIRFSPHQISFPCNILCILKRLRRFEKTIRGVKNVKSYLFTYLDVYILMLMIKFVSKFVGTRNFF